MLCNAYQSVVHAYTRPFGTKHVGFLVLKQLKMQFFFIGGTSGMPGYKITQQIPPELAVRRKQTWYRWIAFVLKCPKLVLGLTKEADQVSEK